MTIQVAQHLEAPSVNLIRSERSLDLVKQAYESHNGSDLTLTSFKIRQAQHDLIKALAESTSESQASIVRAIIDEWCEAKLRGCD